MNPIPPTLADMVRASELQLDVQQQCQVYSEQLRKTHNRLMLYMRLMQIYGGELLVKDVPAIAWSSGQTATIGSRLNLKV